MAILLDIKNFVASQMGRADGATPNAKRDILINRARAKFYNERRWSFLRKTAIVNITARQGDLPTGFNKKFDPYSVYTYTGNVKFEYKKVEWDDVEAHDSGFYVYAVDKTTSQIKINQTTVSQVTMDFPSLPADAALDGSADNATEAAPDITAIGLLAVAYHWLSSERSTGKYQLFVDEYEKALAQVVQNDAATQPVRPLRGSVLDTGYTRRTNTSAKRGYSTYL